MKQNKENLPISLPEGLSVLVPDGERFVPGRYSQEVEFEHYHRYLFACNYCQGKRVLDIASGEGYGSFILSQVAGEVIGVDIDPASIAEATRRYPGIEFKVGDCRDIPLSDDSVDVVVSFETIEHIIEHASLLKEIKRVLVPDGILVISSPDKEAYNADLLEDNEFHLRELSRGDFEALLQQYFANVKLVIQKAFAGSALVAQDGDRRAAEFFERSRNDVRKNAGIDGSYCVAVASDISVSVPQQSIYSGTTSRNFLSRLTGGIEERDRVIAENRAELQRIRKESVNLQIDLLGRMQELQVAFADSVLAQRELKQSLTDAQSSRDKIIARTAELEHSLSVVLHSMVGKKTGKISFSSMIRFCKGPRRFLRLRKEAIIIARSGLFDPIYYLDTNCDVLTHAVEPLWHFLQRGWSEGRQPNRFFDCNYYLSKYPDVREAGINPLIHYALSGEQEGRQPSPFFDPRYYLARHIDVTKAGISPLLHYLRYGQYESRQTVVGSAVADRRDELEILWSSKFIDLNYYIENNKDVREAGCEPCEHFLTNGFREPDRKLSPLVRSADLFSGDLSNLLEELDKARALFSVHGLPTIQRDYERISFAVCDNPLVSVVIPVFNQWHFTYNCLKSLALLEDQVSFEVIIADDNSTDQTKQADQYITGARVVRNRGERGFVHNCNNAAMHARGRYLFFLNNDTAVWNGALDALVEPFNSKNQVGIVGARLIYSDRRLQEAGGIVWKDGTGWNYGRDDVADKPEYMYLKEVDYVSGAALMVERELWQLLGGFDQCFAPAYYEDTDLCMQVRQHGKSVLYQPLAKVTHFEGVSNGRDLKSGLKASQIVNQGKFLAKWENILQEQHLAVEEGLFFARDRSKDKKTILFIDHMFMTFDQDAGSRNQFTYLKLACEKDMNVKFMGMNFDRLQPYADIFEQMGVECLVGKSMADGGWKRWFEQNGSFIDYVFIHRPSVAKEVIDVVRSMTHAAVLYNVADLPFLRYREEYRVTGDDRCFRLAGESEIEELDLAKKMDVTYCVSEEEVTLLAAAHPDKKILWMPIYAYDSQDKLRQEVVKSYDTTKDILFVGGFNHPPNIDAVIWFVNSVFPQIKEQLPAIRFYVVGSNPPREILALQGDDVIIYGRVNDQELSELYNSARVVVIPLRYGAGLKGKTIEAMYYNTPFVGTSFAIQGYPERDSMFTAYDDPLSFVNAVVQLYSDKLAWQAEVKKYGEYVKRYFSKEKAEECFRMGLGEIISKECVR